MGKNIVTFKNISKVYDQTLALDDISFSVRKGEIHAICGENGAGKSTLIKILTGAINPTSGKIIYDKISYDSFTPIKSLMNGTTAIYQEFSLIPYLSIADNIFLGQEINRCGVRDTQTMNQKAQALCDSMGVQLDVTQKVSNLGVAHQQIVEILKAVSKNVQVIIMDEPTAPLTIKETEIFFKIVQRLKDNGTTILFISHRLEEVFDICDRVTVLCDGKYITTEDVDQLTKSELISLMVGRELTTRYPKKNIIQDSTIFKVKNIRSNHVHNISFNVKQGEIFGVGGLVGAGRTELASALFGLDPIFSGKVYINKKAYIPKNPKHALQSGLGYIPEDRKNQGLVMDFTVQENMTYSVLNRISKFGVIDQNRENEIAKKYTNILNVKTPSLFETTRNLSGGNQQKVVLSKLMAVNCDVLIFDEPTRGIDVGAKQEIYEIISDFANDGKGVILISSDMPELIGMSDRIFVMSAGYGVGELSGDEISQEKILRMASSRL